jgi:hypothetical protein
MILIYNFNVLFLYIIVPIRSFESGVLLNTTELKITQSTLLATGITQLTFLFLIPPQRNAFQIFCRKFFLYRRFCLLKPLLFNS